MRTTHVGPVEVSVTGLGTASLVKHADRDTSAAVVRAALDCGITFFDTADSYGEGRCGRSEELLGDVLAGTDRRNVAIATKFGTEFAGTAGGARPEHVRRSLFGSLRRLRTDYVDIYYLHVPDPMVPIADTLGAMDEHVRAGHARAIGCCNLSAAELSEATTRVPGRTPVLAVQDRYNLLDRTVENDILPICRAGSVGFVAYAPLAEGLLTGKYVDGARPPGSRLDRITEARARRLAAPARVARVAEFVTLCRARGLRPAQVALAWTSSRPGVTAVVPGATSPDQVRESVVEVALDAELRRDLTRIFDGGPSEHRVDPLRTPSS
jgi:aryl-alcohol dehydrogenase-like predicted oxidoreductase